MAEYTQVLRWEEEQIINSKKCNQHFSPGMINTGGQNTHTANQLN